MERILVLENDRSLGWLIAKLLGTKYDVVLMNNGLDALAWLSEGHECDLIVSDLNMPLLDGIELLEHVKGSTFYQDIPVIILSALEDAKNQCLELGAAKFLVKPFEPQRFVQAIETTITENRKLVA
jgi:CheY-like chemotaxis protein